MKLQVPVMINIRIKNVNKCNRTIAKIIYILTNNRFKIIEKLSITNRQNVKLEIYNLILKNNRKQK